MFLAATLLGLAVSAMLMADYLRPAPAFCVSGSKCAVFAYPKSYIKAIPIPLLGILAFGGTLASWIVISRRFNPALNLLPLLLGPVGLLLILVQIVSGKIGPLCMIVDTSAIVITITYLKWSQCDRWNAQRLSHRYRVLAAGVAVLVLPFVWSWLTPVRVPRLPDSITRRRVPGKLNVIELTDFGCPACLRMHRALARVVPEFGESVHVTRVIIPLAATEARRLAARTYVCADRLGKGDAMADALFDPDRFAHRRYTGLAAVAGLSESEFEATLSSPDVDQEIDAHVQWARDSGLAGLPVVLVGDEVIFGSRAADDLRQAFRKAASRVPGLSATTSSRPVSRQTPGPR